MALYPLFRMVMHSLRASMHASRLAGEVSLVRPDFISKTSYHYSLDNVHEFNIYRRTDKETKNLPLMIDIHGGCWFYGDKDSYDAFSYEMVKKGLNVTSLTYRTADKATLKDQVQDIFTYIHFLEDNQDHLNLSMENVMLTGDSAGAQLSLLCYAINQDPELQKIFEVKPFSTQISCMVLTHPVCFIDTAARIPDNKLVSDIVANPGLKRLLYGIGYEFKPEYHRSLRPERYITEKIKLPPILLVTSKGDDNFLYQSEKLARFFVSRGIPFSYFYEDNPDAKHVYNVNFPSEDHSKKCNDRIFSFFMESVYHKQKDQSKVLLENLTVEENAEDEDSLPQAFDLQIHSKLLEDHEPHQHGLSALKNRLSYKAGTHQPV